MPIQAEIQPGLSLDLGEVGRLRVRPAEFARMLGVSRQSVSRWIASGKVTLGTDGKLDPIEGYRQVTRNTDPARVRARFLRLAASGEAGLRKRVEELEKAVEFWRGEVGFADGAASELLAQLDALARYLRDEWADLHRLGPAPGLAALNAWLAAAEEVAGDPGFGIVEAGVCRVAGLPDHLGIAETIE